MASHIFKPVCSAGAARLADDYYSVLGVERGASDMDIRKMSLPVKA